MDNSILYGLRNPAMTDDIGMTMIERQFPTTISPINPMPSDGGMINPGQPLADTYQSKRQKEYSIIKKVLVGLVVLALGIFGLKKGSKLVKQAYNYVKTNAKPFYQKCKNFIKNIFK